MIDNIVNVFVSILLFLDSIVYSLISWVYQIILVLCQVDILNNSFEIDALINRIYVIIGVIVMFLLAYSLLKSMVNPDDALKGKKSPIVIIKDVIISIVLIALIPNIFSFAMKFQNAILMENTIGKIILGSSPNNLNQTSEEIIKDGGVEISANILQAFLHPEYDKCTLKDDFTYDCSNVEIATKNVIGWVPIVSFFININGGNENYDTIWNSIKESGNFLSITSFAYSISHEAQVSYYYIISTAAGVFVLFVLLSYCIDIAIRTVKLAVFQLIAPLPILSRLMPNEQGNKVFNNWIKATVSTYVEVFIRLAILFFAVLLIKVVVQNLPSLIIGGGFISGTTSFTVYLFAQLFIIIGIILFVKQAPQIIKDITGLDGSKYGKSLIRGVGMMTSTLGGGVTAAIRKTVSDMNEHPEYGKGKRVANTLSALGGGMRRGLWHGSKVEKFGDIPKMAGKTASNTLAHQAQVDAAGGNINYYKQKGKDIMANANNWLSGSFEAQQKELELVNEFLKDAKAVKSTTEGLVRDKKYLFNMVGKGQAAKNYQTADGETIILDENTSLSAVDSIIQSLKATGKVADAKLADEINNEMQQRIKKIGQAMATSSVDRSQVPKFNNDYMMAGKNIEAEAMPTLATAASQYTIIQQKYKQNSSLDAVINFQTDENGNHRDLQPDNVSKLADSLEAQAAKISQNIKIEQERRKANSGGKKS